ncbi:hypothetical protein HGRIS_012706 [Hohenbuehelia grisea]|uniref:C3H1-type domain-containing protein n=1 Tax=Hohenbuehelia grisea TaxID=104357 RepID=A0ABR3IT87_9AGAR
MSWRVKTRPCPFYNSPSGCIFDDKCNFLHPRRDPRLSGLLKALGDVVPQDEEEEDHDDLHAQSDSFTLVQPAGLVKYDQLKHGLHASITMDEPRPFGNDHVEDDLTIRPTPIPTNFPELLSPVGSEVSNLPSTPFPVRDSQRASYWSRDSSHASWHSPRMLDHSPPRSPSLSFPYVNEINTFTRPPPHPQSPDAEATPHILPQEPSAILSGSDVYASPVNSVLTADMLVSRPYASELSGTGSIEDDTLDFEYSASAETSWEAQDDRPTAVYTGFLTAEPVALPSKSPSTQWLDRGSTSFDENEVQSSSSFSAPATPDLSYSSESSSEDHETHDDSTNESDGYSDSDDDASPDFSSGFEHAGLLSTLPGFTSDSWHDQDPESEEDPDDGANEVEASSSHPRNVVPGENDTLTSLYDVYSGSERSHALSPTSLAPTLPSDTHLSLQGASIVSDSSSCPPSAAFRSPRSRSSSASVSTTPSSPASVPSTSSSSAKTPTRSMFAFERERVFTPPPPPLPFTDSESTLPSMAVAIISASVPGTERLNIPGRKRSGTLTELDREASCSNQKEELLGYTPKEDIIPQSSPRTELLERNFGLRSSFTRVRSSSSPNRANAQLPHSSPAASTQFGAGFTFAGVRASPPASAGLVESGIAPNQQRPRGYLKPLRLSTALRSSSPTPSSASSSMRSSIHSSISSSSSLSSLAMSLAHAASPSEASVSPEIPSSCTSSFPDNTHDSCVSSRRSSLASFSSVSYASRNSFISSAHSFNHRTSDFTRNFANEPSSSTSADGHYRSSSRLSQSAFTATDDDDQEDENTLSFAHDHVIRRPLPLTLQSPPPGARRLSRAAQPASFASTPPGHAPSHRHTSSSLDSPHAVATPSPSLLFAIASDNPAAVRDVLEHGGASPNEGLGPQSALAFAATNARLENRLEIVKVLLAYGADPRSLPKGKSGEEDKGKGSMVRDERDSEVVTEMDAATKYYIARAGASHTRQTSALMHRSFFRPLTRVRYELIGQDRALEQLFKVLSIHSRKLSVSPVVVLLCGPSGHGKSLLARRFGSLLDVPTHTVNMTTVRSTHDLWRSYSMSPYEEEPSPSTLAEFLILNEGKRCVVVLDEIEKAEDEKTLHSLLMPWELGRCSIEAGKPHIDVRNVIWIGTSNIGHDMVFEYQASRDAPEGSMDREDYSQLMSLLRPRVSERLGASILSRVTTVLPFVPFTCDEKRAIASEALCTLAGEIYRTLSDATVEKLIEDAVSRYLPAEGARSLYRAVSEALVDVI